MTDKEKISQLEAQVKGLTQLVQELEEKLSLTLRLLSEQQVKKDSNNSHQPASKDLPKKTKSLRKASGKKSGGQSGHKGSTLKMVSTPDQVEELKPSFCNNCGSSFTSSDLVYVKSRQVIDIPLPPPLVTEYRQYSGTCSCGCQQLGEFPQDVKAPVQYGKNLEALVGYLSVSQYIPYKRMTELFRDVFSLPISQGTVDNMLIRLSDKAQPYYQTIQSELSKSNKPVGADETSCSVNGDLYWAWTWQNEDYCYLTIDKSRGYSTVENNFPDGFPNATLCSDRWAAHLNTTAKRHQICLIHLIRELNYLEALEKNSFSIALRTLFQEAIHEKKIDRVYQYGDQKSKNWEERLNELLAQTIPKEQFPKTATLQRSLIKLRKTVFPFLYEEKLSADNNASERCVRNFKVKMKVSGLFKSGHPIYATLKSVTETLKKKKQNIFDAFTNLANSKYHYYYAE